MIETMNQRTQDIFRLVVDRYLATGRPIGSRDISDILSGKWSPATIRNNMSDLEDMGLLLSPHTSAGRMPSEAGLRLFVDEMLEITTPDADTRKQIDALQTKPDANLEGIFKSASELVSGLTRYAAIVAAPKLDRIVSQIQFARLPDGRTMAVVVFTDGAIDNRIINTPIGLDPIALERAANYLNARLAGKTISQMRGALLEEIRDQKSQLDALSADLAEQGLIIPGTSRNEYYVRGYANLLDSQAIGDIEHLQSLLDTLDRQENMATLLDAADNAQGVRVFIGRENALFPHTGISLITAPARGASGQIIGTISVIGPSHMQYGRIIPIVDYTSQVMARLIG